MATELPTHANGATLNGDGNGAVDSAAVKEGLARMLKGGVIMDVVNAEQVRCLPPLQPVSINHGRELLLKTSI